MRELDAESPQSALDPPQAGSISSKYHLLMELGRGGTAVVHAALARGLGGFSKLVVLKITRSEIADHPHAVPMFLNEARVSARMNHPNVVQVYEVVEDQGLPVIVMEYLEGQSLAMILRRLAGSSESQPQEGAAAKRQHWGLSVLCKALEGLHYAHSLTDFSGRPLGIIHRDVTPHNIFVTYDGQVKLLDFGIAKLNASTTHTNAGVIKGKLAYMPREQIDGSTVDCRADIFALGVIMWELVAGQRMWGALSDATLMKHLLCNDIPRLRHAKPDVDPEIERIVGKAVAAEPAQRYASAHELLTTLTNYLESHGGVASQSAIAEIVNRSCADLRAQSKQRLERELAKFSHSADRSWDEVPAEFTGSGSRAVPDKIRALRPVEGQALHDTVTRTGFAGQTHSNLPPRRRYGRTTLFGIGGIALMMLGAWIASQVSPVLQHEMASAPAAASASGVPTTPTPAPIRLALRASPAQAVLYLDGVRLESNPYARSMPSDQSEHELRVLADGFTPIVRSLRLDADIELRLSLEQLTAASTSAKNGLKSSRMANLRAGRRRPSRSRTLPRVAVSSTDRPPTEQAAASPSKSAPTDPCNPPYVVNELGIKRYKRECLK
jgi:serine/threonine protein kinase